MTSALEQIIESDDFLLMANEIGEFNALNLRAAYDLMNDKERKRYNRILAKMSKEAVEEFNRYQQYATNGNKILQDVLERNSESWTDAESYARWKVEQTALFYLADVARKELLSLIVVPKTAKSSDDYRVHSDFLKNLEKTGIEQKQRRRAERKLERKLELEDKFEAGRRQGIAEGRHEMYQQIKSLPVWRYILRLF